MPLPWERQGWPLVGILRFLFSLLFYSFGLYCAFEYFPGVSEVFRGILQFVVGIGRAARVGRWGAKRTHLDLEKSTNSEEETNEY